MGHCLLSDSCVMGLGEWMVTPGIAEEGGPRELQGLATGGQEGEAGPRQA